MPTPWNPTRLTSAARAALCSANLRPRKGSLRPEHVFAAVGELRQSVALAALKHLGLSWSALGVPRAERRRAKGWRLRRGERPSREPSGRGDPVLSEVSKQLFDHAAYEAEQLGHHPINTGHLVLAILRRSAGPLPADAKLDHARFAAALKEVLAKPWVHGYALDGEFTFYLTQDETLVLYSALVRRHGRRVHAEDQAEGVVIGGLLNLIRPVCEGLLGDRLEGMDRARRAVLRLARGSWLRD